MTEQARFAKAHSQRVAAEYLRLGWKLCCEFRVTDGEEPYEYLFKWVGKDDPVRPDWSGFKRQGPT
jgi:hypothetical protein